MEEDLQVSPPLQEQTGEHPIRLSADMLAGRGGQTFGKDHRRPTRPASRGGRTRPARASVRVPPGQEYSGRDTLRPGPGRTACAGGRGSRWSLIRYLQRVQLPALGPHRGGLYNTTGSHPILGGSFGPIYRTDGSSTGTTMWSL